MFSFSDLLGAYSSAGEHFVDIEGVTGSIPVTPTIPAQKGKETRRIAFVMCEKGEGP